MCACTSDFVSVSKSKLKITLVEDGDTTRSINIHKCLHLWGRYPGVTSLIWARNNIFFVFLFDSLYLMSKQLKLSGVAARRLKTNSREEYLTKYDRSIDAYL